MSHYNPNLSQVPAVYSLYGKECRKLFKVRHRDNKFVGADADGLELRCLAHDLYRWDGGAYGRAVLYGDKEKGTDREVSYVKRTPSQNSSISKRRKRIKRSNGNTSLQLRSLNK